MPALEPRAPLPIRRLPMVDANILAGVDMVKTFLYPLPFLEPQARAEKIVLSRARTPLVAERAKR